MIVLKIIKCKNNYNDMTRIEESVSEHELFEDLIMLSRQAEIAAKAAYTYSRCDDNYKARAKATLYNTMGDLQMLYDLISGYDINSKEVDKDD